jgi:HSP20 family molecular chaperone IbpA
MSNGTFSTPYLLGFDHLERLLERTAKTANEGYPPTTIEQTGPERLRIALAVAGFSRDDVNVTVEDNQLIVGGRQTETPGKAFLHRGIAARQFLRSFVLADGIEVAGSRPKQRTLSIDLARHKPESVTRRVDIKVENNKGRQGDRL